MRYSLLDLLSCQYCQGELTALVLEEAASSFPAGLAAEATRVNRPGDTVGPVPSWRAAGPLTALLGKCATPPAAVSRSLEVVVKEGLLACGECGRWYPVGGFLPELLPDHLRDETRDRGLLERMAAVVPADLMDGLRGAPRTGSATEDAGASYKRAEISIKEKVDDPAFFGPGYSSPFNPWNPDFTTYLIRVFANVLPLLELKKGDVVLDSGCGYAWTTEWMFRSGFEAIGVDITRTYLDIGVQRMGGARPHLIVADVENLPLRDASVRGVLAYESFHHIPDRNRAMRGYARILQDGGVVVLAEPGGEHEHADVSVETMTRFGILEKGMELSDVVDYLAGTALGALEQLYVMRVAREDLGRVVDRGFARDHAVIEGNVFRMRKGGGPVRDLATGLRDPRRVLWPRVKRRLKSAARRLGLE
jgi:SAM-dependent methyltransferase/uncharacterized protein YbaR (Trm112 family)